MIEFDVETTGLQWYANDLFLVQFFFPEDEKATIYKHPQDRELIQAALERDDSYRAWNAKFDLHFLDAAGYKLPPQDRWHDGMVIAKLIDETSSAALESRGEAIFGPSVRDDEKLLKEWLATETKRRRKISKATGELMVRPNYSDVPDEIMYPYAGGDVELTRAVCDVLEPKLNDELKNVYELERGTLSTLYDMEKHGMRVDVPAAERFEHQLEEDLDRLHGEAVELAGVPTFNPASGAQLAEALERRGADLTFAKVLKSGKHSVDKDTLETLTDDALARKVLELRQSQTLYGRYIYPMLHSVEDKRFGVRAPLIANDGYIHGNFHQVGARHGRMSSSDPNIQNIPRDDLRVRYLVIPSEGNVLVSADLSSVEMVLLGAFTGEGPLFDLIRSGADLHNFTAEEMRLEDKDRGGGVVEPARQVAKKFNYERIFGGGVRAIRKWHRVPQAKAKQMLERYYQIFPEVQEFQERIEATLEDQGYVKTPIGRRQRVRDIRFVDREAYKFVNYLISGTAADIIKEAAVKVHEAGIPIANIVHDEILADVPVKDAPEAAVVIREALIDHPYITNIVPLDAESKIVDRWSHAKDKLYIPEYDRKR